MEKTVVDLKQLLKKQGNTFNEFIKGITQKCYRQQQEENKMLREIDTLNMIETLKNSVTNYTISVIEFGCKLCSLKKKWSRIITISVGKNIVHTIFKVKKRSEPFKNGCG